MGASEARSASCCSSIHAPLGPRRRIHAPYVHPTPVLVCTMYKRARRPPRGWLERSCPSYPVACSSSQHLQILPRKCLFLLVGEGYWRSCWRPKARRNCDLGPPDVVGGCTIHWGRGTMLVGGVYTPAWGSAASLRAQPCPRTWANCHLRPPKATLLNSAVRAL